MPSSEEQKTTPAPLPNDEADRMTAVRQVAFLSTLRDEGLDALVQLGARLFEVPIVAITVIDDERQWFISQTGLDVGETTRDDAFCSHAILEPDLPMIVPDAARDVIFEGNALVQGEPRIRFYAGIPLRLTDDHPVGSFCIIDREPRQELTTGQLEVLTLLAEVARSHLLLRIALSKTTT